CSRRRPPGTELKPDHPEKLEFASSAPSPGIRCQPPEEERGCTWDQPDSCLAARPRSRNPAVACEVSTLPFYVIDRPLSCSKLLANCRIFIQAHVLTCPVQSARRKWDCESCKSR